MSLQSTFRLGTNCFQSNLRCPVIRLISLVGAGPKPQTVRDPSLIYVNPASATKYTGMFCSFAFLDTSSLNEFLNNLLLTIPIQC